MALDGRVILFAHHFGGYGVGFGLILVVGVVDGHFALQSGHAGPLLHHVGQLMADQLLATAGGGIILSGTEEDVTAGGEGLGPQLPAEVVGRAVCMHLDAAEILAHDAARFAGHAFIQAVTGAAPAVDGRGRTIIQFRGAGTGALG